MSADPRLQLNQKPEQDPEFLEALEQATRYAQVANELLSNTMVTDFFEDIIRGAYHDFCNLPEGSSVDDYRALHLRAKGIIYLRDMLKHWINRKGELLRQQEQDEHLRQGEI